MVLHDVYRKKSEIINCVHLLCIVAKNLTGEKDCPLLCLISSFYLYRKSCVNIFQTLRTIDEHGQTGENIKTGKNHHCDMYIEIFENLGSMVYKVS